MVWEEERDSFGPFLIVAVTNPSGGLNKKIQLSELSLCWVICASFWGHVGVERRNEWVGGSRQMTSGPLSTWGSREATEGWRVQIKKRPLRSDVLRMSASSSFTLLQAVTLTVLLASLSAKDRVFTWWICAAVQRPGPPRRNWNVNAYWAAVNTCNPAGPWGRRALGRLRSEGPHKEDRSLQECTLHWKFWYLGA